jgi:Fe-S-cluster containining protein
MKRQRESARAQMRARVRKEAKEYVDQDPEVMTRVLLVYICRYFGRSMSAGWAHPQMDREQLVHDLGNQWGERFLECGFDGAELGLRSDVNGREVTAMARLMGREVVRELLERWSATAPADREGPKWLALSGDVLYLDLERLQQDILKVAAQCLDGLSGEALREARAIQRRIGLPVISAEECRGCGACCRDVGRPPVYDSLVRLEHEAPELLQARLRGSGVEADWRRLRSAPPEARQLIVDSLATGDLGPRGPCCWLDPKTRTCRFYEWRPDICRNDVKAGGPSCRRALIGSLGIVCGVSGQGAPVSAGPGGRP